jgi:hypothetical protein
MSLSFLPHLPFLLLVPFLFSPILLFLHKFLLYYMITLYMGAHGSLVVKALGYKPKGRGFETR